MTRSAKPFHDEVLRALQAEAPDAAAGVGERIRLDRGSELVHLGVRTPVRRKIVKAGFSFSNQPDAELLQTWDAIWSASPVADVMFAALDHYRDQLKRAVPAGFWPVAVHWIERVDNWAHADDLARVYSWALEADHDAVYPDLVRWNGDERVWHRRISIVSLVHYSGKNAVFLGPDLVFPLVANCLEDDRPEIQKSVGWVLREMTAAYPDEGVSFMCAHRDALSAVALRRATERLDDATIQRIRNS